MNASVVATNACAWPVLLRLRPGCIGVVYFNRPSHGFEEGDLATRISFDEGATWLDGGLAAPHPAGANRMHIASGLDEAGTWVVLSTGFRVEDGRMTSLEPVWCSTSATPEGPWNVCSAVSVEGPRGFSIPHGRIFPTGDGRLAATFYASDGRGRPSHSWVAWSNDGGGIWRNPTDIGAGDSNEVCLLPLHGDRWLAAARTHVDHHVELHESIDAGRSWVRKGLLTLPMQHPADLTDLGDDHVLLTYGIRNRGLMGVGLRLSRDGGATWGAPAVLYQFGADATDCGYPSTIRTADGGFATACYSDLSPLHRGYHLLLLRWQFSEFFAPKVLRSISDGGPLQA
jgi:hypothetical protein